MGADFIWEVFYIPTFTDGTDLKLSDIPLITPELKDRIRAGQWEKEAYMFMIESLELDWDNTTPVNDPNTEQVIIDNLTEIFDPKNRETGWGKIEGQEFILSGGMTWGDSPTEAVDTIYRLNSTGLFDEPFDRNYTSPNTRNHNG